MQNCVAGWISKVNHRRDHLRLMRRSVLFLLGYISLVACTTVTPTPAFPTQITATTAAAVPASPAPSPTPIPIQIRTQVSLPPRVEVLAANLPEPDDLLLASDGSILLSDVKDGTIRQYGLDGQLRLILSGLDEPEGMALAPDEALIIAEQGRNRLVRYDFASGTLSPFLNLVNHTHNLGVDNILGNGTHLIVPDSPNGTVLEASWDGSTIRQLASGLARPTGAWVEADGSLLLADENGNAVLRLHSDGTLEKVADLSVPDDVVADASGNIFVITLGDDAIHMITADPREDVVLLGGLSNPQGIILDLDGNLIVTDPGHHELIKVIIH